MKIIMLEDESLSVNTFLETIGIGHDVIAVNNLLSFHDLLYSEPGANYYDIFIMDMRVDISEDINEDHYYKWLQDIGIDKPTHINNYTEIIGWDYYIKVITKSDTTKNLLDRFILKTGYADLIKTKISEKELALARHLVSKGAEDRDEIIREVIAKYNFS